MELGAEFRCIFIHIRNEGNGAELAADFVVQVHLDAFPDSQLVFARLSALIDQNQGEGGGGENDGDGAKGGMGVLVGLPDRLHGVFHAVKFIQHHAAADEIDTAAYGGIP